MSVYFILAKKTSLRKLHPELIQQQVDQFKDRILKSGRTKKGWRMCNDEACVDKETVKVIEELEAEEGKEPVKREVEKEGFGYTVRFYVTCRSKGKRLDGIVGNEFQEIVHILERTSKSKSWAVLDNGKMPDDFSYPGADEEEEVLQGDTECPLSGKTGEDPEATESPGNVTSEVAVA